MAEGTPESGQEGTFSCFAREFPDLVLENVCTHFTVSEFTRWGRCCKMMNAIAQQDLFWARRFRERNWDLEPLPIRSPFCSLFLSVVHFSRHGTRTNTYNHPPSRTGSKVTFLGEQGRGVAGPLGAELQGGGAHDDKRNQGRSAGEKRLN